MRFHRSFLNFISCRRIYTPQCEASHEVLSFRVAASNHARYIPVGCKAEDPPKQLRPTPKTRRLARNRVLSLPPRPQCPLPLNLRTRVDVRESRSLQLRSSINSHGSSHYSFSALTSSCDAPGFLLGFHRRSSISSSAFTFRTLNGLSRLVLLDFFRLLHWLVVYFLGGFQTFGADGRVEATANRLYHFAEPEDV